MSDDLDPGSEGLISVCADAAIDVRAPDALRTPFIFASPHSGRTYLDAFVRGALPPLQVLRRSEDAYVDQLFQAAPELGAPLICALFPRVYVDPNRGPDELDPAMFAGAYPRVGLMPGGSHAPSLTARASAGLGVIPRVAADGRALYPARLTYEDARTRLHQLYHPYHRAIRQALDAARAEFGRAVIIDCHSMPAASARGADIVLGDRYGASCSRALVARAEAEFRALGFAVVRNRPYAGGYTTEHYGQPSSGIEALQIEINRGLYLDEAKVAPSKGLPALQTALSHWMRAMTGAERSDRVAAE